MLDPARLEALAAELEWLAGELRAAQADGVVAGERPVELSEADMARHLGVHPDALRSHRRNGNCIGLWRSVGKMKLWLVAPTEEWAAEKLGRSPAMDG